MYIDPCTSIITNCLDTRPVTTFFFVRLTDAFITGLKAKDLDRVYNAVIGARSKWYHIGLALEIDPDDLDSIKDANRGNPDGCLTDVLKKFLRQVSPKPSWKRLADAMASLSVGRGDIAEDLRKQYC